MQFLTAAFAGFIGALTAFGIIGFIIFFKEKR